ncbi:MAG: MFS transporter, partial [Peptococcaceae bacterium]|nr:MFS transporter [Peptococcaceae bacterium]
LLGALASIMSIMKFVGRPVAGRITDMFNKPKLVLVLACMSYAVAHILFIFTNNVAMFAVSRVVYGFVAVFEAVSIAAVVAAVAGRKALGAALGVFAFCPKLVRSVAPMLSVWLEQAFGAKSAFIGSTVIFIICILLALGLDETNIVMVKKKKQTTAQAFSLGNFIAFGALPVCGIRFFSSFMFVLTKTYLVIFGKEVGIANAAVYFTMYSLASMWGGLVGGPVYDKKGIDWIMYPMLLGAAGATLLIGFGANDWSCMAAGVLFGFTYGMSNPACSAAAQKSVMPDRRGIAAATNLLVPDICSIVTGVVAGAMVGALGYAGTFKGMAIFPIVGLVVYTALRKGIKTLAAKIEAEIAAAIAAES